MPSSLHFDRAYGYIRLHENGYCIVFFVHNSCFSMFQLVESFLLQLHCFDDEASNAAARAERREEVDVPDLCKATIAESWFGVLRGENFDKDLPTKRRNIWSCNQQPTRGSCLKHGSSDRVFYLGDNFVMVVWCSVSFLYMASLWIRGFKKNDSSRHEGILGSCNPP